MVGNLYNDLKTLAPPRRIPGSVHQDWHRMRATPIQVNTSATVRPLEGTGWSRGC